MEGLQEVGNVSTFKIQRLDLKDLLQFFDGVNSMQSSPTPQFLQPCDVGNVWRFLRTAVLLLFWALGLDCWLLESRYHSVNWQPQLSVLWQSEMGAQREACWSEWLEWWPQAFAPLLDDHSTTRDAKSEWHLLWPHEWMLLRVRKRPSTVRPQHFVSSISVQSSALSRFYC